MSCTSIQSKCLYLIHKLNIFANTTLKQNNYFKQTSKQENVTVYSCSGNYTVDITWNNGKLTTALLHAGTGGRCNIHYAGHDVMLKTKKGHFYKISYADDNLKIKEVR